MVICAYRLHIAPQRVEEREGPAVSVVWFNSMDMDMDMDIDIDISKRL